MENVKESKLALFSFFERTPDLVCIAGKDGFFKRINPTVINKLGYTQEELFAQPISSFIHEDDREFTHHNRQELLEGKVLHNFVNRYITRSGEIIWLDWTSIYFSDDEVVFAVAKDVTATKKLEKETEENYIKFKGLTTHFKKSIENDRKYFAYELHEEIAQLAAVIKLHGDWIRHGGLDLADPIKDRVKEMADVSDLLIKKIRQISFTMSPNSLDYLGLNDTIEWLCRDFSALHGISCALETNYDEAGLTHEIRIDFFRVCQEALKNIAAHSEAKNVKIIIEDIDDKIHLSIADDGKGFDTNVEKASDGFTTMHGRAASINGKLLIKSKPGEGTLISFTAAKK